MISPLSHVLVAVTSCPDFVNRSELEDERASWSSRLEEMTTNKKKIEEKLVSVKKKRAKVHCILYMYM